MATWHIEHEGREVVLTYQDGAVCKPCGRGGVELLPDLVAWVVEHAAPWDQVRTERVIFVRQVGPKTAVEQMLS